MNETAMRDLTARQEAYYQSQQFLKKLMAENKSKREIIIIDPTVVAITEKRRVAAYCRVSTDQDEQLTSYEAQKQYYTDLIMQKKEWTMAGVLADEGITGTSAKKRPQFLKLIRMCERGKIDVVLTKSISFI